MLNKKAQSAAELTIIIAIILILFIFFLTIVNTRNQVSTSLSKRFSAEEVGVAASSAINEAYLGGFGTNKTIFLPSTLRNQINYNITIFASENIMRLQTEDVTLFYPLLTKNISGEFILSQDNELINKKRGIQIN